jgi:hypothetical protein
VGEWRKSSLSLSNSHCVQVRGLQDGGVAVRNSRDPDGPVLVYTPAEWAAFLDGAKSGEFDDLMVPSAPSAQDLAANGQRDPGPDGS